VGGGIRVVNLEKVIKDVEEFQKQSDKARSQALTVAGKHIRTELIGSYGGHVSGVTSPRTWGKRYDNVHLRDDLSLTRIYGTGSVRKINAGVTTGQTHASWREHFLEAPNRHYNVPSDPVSDKVFEREHENAMNKMWEEYTNQLGI